MEYKLGPHQSLITKSTEWNFFTDGDAELLEASMIKFMLTCKGIGLAANQIEITKRVFIIGSENIVGFPKPFACFNPRILEYGTEQILDEEGCLSYPGLFLKIKRPTWVIAEYQNSKGDLIEAKFEGYLAKCFQHELDHLDGICFVDRVSRLKLNLAMKKLKKVK